MSTTPVLTSQAIRQIAAHHERSNGPEFQPTMQVINIRSVDAGGQERYRVVLSDGAHYVQGMLATSLNPLVTSQQLQQNTVILVQEYMRNVIHGRMVVVLLRVQVMDTLATRIGEPVNAEEQPWLAELLATPLNNATNNNPPSNTSAKPATPNPYQHASNPAAAPVVRINPAASSPITKIMDLNMYQNKWTIKARLVAKSDIRTWSNAKGEGSLFSAEFLDESHDIRATFFREAVDKFYHTLQVGQVYRLSGGKLKVANAQYNNCKSAFEITFDQNAEIHLDNDDKGISKINYNFLPIEQLEHTPAQKNVDVLGVVTQIAEPITLIAKKSGQEIVKCDVTLLDTSGTSIVVALWGDTARTAPQHCTIGQVVAVRRARVSDYNGKSLSGGDLDAHPDVPQKHTLLKWYQSHGQEQVKTLSASNSSNAGKAPSLNERNDIAAIKLQNMGHNPEKADWISFKATLSFIKKDKEGGAWYPACANAQEPCKNRFKVTQTTDGQWYCDKCNHTYPNCVRRWIFSGVIEDDSSSTWVSFFNEQAETLLGNVTADTVYEQTYGNNNDQDAYDSYFARANHTEWIFKCKVKTEMVNDESRVKTSVVSLHPVDYVKESQDLLHAIASF